MLIERKAEKSSEYVSVKDNRQEIFFYFTINNKSDAKLFYEYITNYSAHPSKNYYPFMFTNYLVTGKYPKANKL
jgi:hypothetical protein